MRKKISNVLLVAFMITLIMSSCQTHNTDANTYKIVTPTQEEISEIGSRLSPIISTHFENYNCLSDDIYNNLFSYNHLKYVCPEYNEEIAEFVDKPLNVLHDTAFWSITVYENDPLAAFGTIPSEAYNEKGVIDKELAYDCLGLGELIGYNKFSGLYIDWLIEGVWNGKARHDTIFSFADGSKCYYHDGYYYTPEEISALGGGIFHYSEIQHVSPIGDNKYEIKYAVYDENDTQAYCGTAVIALKESRSGFRFWSFFSINVEDV